MCTTYCCLPSENGVTLRCNLFDAISSIEQLSRYGLDSPWSESQWGREFSAPVHIGPGAHPASCQVGTGLFPGVKRPGRGVIHPLASSAEVEERVEVYLYSTSVPTRVLG